MSVVIARERADSRATNFARVAFAELAQRRVRRAGDDKRSADLFRGPGRRGVKALTARRSRWLPAGNTSAFARRQARAAA